MKSILITGATRNTGFVMAKKFASEGWAVFITSRNKEAAERAAKEIREEFGTPCFGYEYDPGDIHSTMLVDAIAATGHKVAYTPTFDDAERYLRANWQPGDLVITMSCGDIHLLNKQIQDHGDAYEI